jgi:hypothetical protein
MEEKQIQIEDLLKYLREEIGIKAQEIAVLKATIDNLLSKDKDKVE